MSEQDEYTKAFPQASKLDATKKAGPLLHQFLDWLSAEKEYVLAKWEPILEVDRDEWESDLECDHDERLVHVFVEPRTLILEFCDIDPVAYEAELEKMLARLYSKQED